LVDALNGKIHRVNVKALAAGISYAGSNPAPLKLNQRRQTMSVNSSTQHIIWQDYSKIIRIRCGHIEISLAKKPQYCPNCGENVKEVEIQKP